MSNKKPDRIYNKDRIQRIKEASELAKQNDPNWHDDAPEKIMSNDEDDMPISKMKTPPFLKNNELSDKNIDNIMSKKLTLNELTHCNKDSSQLRDIIHSSSNQINQNQNKSKSVNYLEMSRLKKVKERDDLNRKTAESLDKASEKWHNQIKGYNSKLNNQDSSGVRSSLFNESCPESEKSEIESNEKSENRFHGDFINRLDLLLQRGSRTSKLYRGLGSLRSINERSYNRWSKRIDKYSSLYDLRYPLLTNTLMGKSHHNFNFKPDYSTLMHKMPYDELRRYNEPHPYSQLLNNIPCNNNTMTASNPNLQFNSNMEFQPQFNSQYYNTFPQRTVSDQISVPQQNQLSGLNSMVNSQINRPPNILEKNQFFSYPFQQLPSYDPSISHNYNYHNQFSGSAFQLPQPPSQHYPTNAPNSDFNHLQSVTQKIDMLTGKLDELSSTISQLKADKRNQAIKPIIKCHKSINFSSPDENVLANSVNPTPNKSQSFDLCQCSECFNNKSHPRYNSGDRRVRFDFTDQEKSEYIRKEIGYNVESVFNQQNHYPIVSDNEKHSYSVGNAHQSKAVKKYSDMWST